MELLPEVRSVVADLTYQLRLGLPCGTQVSSNPQTAASPASNVLAACSTYCSGARANVAVYRGLLRQGTQSTLQGNNNA
jgi:hypothetical protein